MSPLVARSPAQPVTSTGVCLAVRITPSGELVLSEGATGAAGGGPALEERLAARIRSAFQRGTGAGLLHLGACEVSTSLPLALGYFRDLMQRLVSAVCALPDLEARRTELDALDLSPPPLGPWLAAVPLMTGSEYLTESALRGLWERALSELRQELLQFPGTAEEYLRQKDPAWHVVGRICFHLAENPRDGAAPFAFLATYSPGVGPVGSSPGGARGTPESRVRHVPLSQALKEYAGAADRPALLRLLAPVQRAAERSPLVKELVDSGRIYHPLRFSVAQAHRLLREVPVLEPAGVVVRLPDFWRDRRPPRPQVRVRIGEESALGASTLLDFSIGLSLDGEELSEEEQAELLRSQGPLVRLRGRWVELDSERLGEVLAHFRRVQREAGRDGLSFIEGMRLLAGARLGGPDEDLALPSELPAWSEVVAGRALARILAGLRDPATLADEELALGARLKTELRPYQKLGVRWLRLITQLGLGACLADDMGLGKTVQVLALLLLRKRQADRQPALLVAPASLLANWCAEAARFAPDLRVRLVHPSARAQPDRELSPEALAESDLVITSYGFLQRTEALTQATWGLLILDEAQAIKNPGSKQTRAVKALRAGSRLALTGTPIENSLSDLWSLFDFLCPGLLGTAREFQRFTQRLVQGGAGGKSAADAGRAHAPLRELVRPYILRRMKSDPRIIADLPDKTELVAYCTLSRAQAVLYQRAVTELSERLATLDGIERRGAVLSCLMMLKQICNHPAQALGHGTYAEAESGKLQRLRELCEAIAARQEKVLVFTQFRELCEPLAGFLNEVFVRAGGRPGLVLHGGTAVKKRQELVAAFQAAPAGEGPSFFVLSLKAGGTGLNLTAASHVIHFDRWWNPAVEDQATDRAYRIGQRRNVLVHKFVCRGTLEERVDQLLGSKRGLAGEILAADSELALTELSDRELLRLLALDLRSAGGEPQGEHQGQGAAA